MDHAACAWERGTGSAWAACGGRDRKPTTLLPDSDSENAALVCYRPTAYKIDTRQGSVYRGGARIVMACHDGPRASVFVSSTTAIACESD